MQNILFILFTLSFLSLMTAHVYLTNAFFKLLKKFHPSVWTSLDEPQWRIHFGDDSFQKAMSYIRKQEFAYLNDERLTKAFKKLKRVEQSALFLAVFIFIITIVDIVSGT